MKGVSDDLAFRIEISPEKVHFGLQICDIRKFCVALRQMTEMPNFWPHSLTVTVSSNPPPSPFPLYNVDLLTDCQQTICDPKTTLQISYQFLSHKQFPGNRHKSQVNIAYREGGGGGGLGGSKQGLSRNVARNKSFVLKQHKTF